MEELQRQHAPDQWKLLIESSKLSLKAVLLNNGKNLPSVPLPHTGTMKETDNIQGLLEKICFEDYQWNVRADLKVVASLNGLQRCYTKCCCFQCK